MATIHLIGGEKGGVGKSVVSRLLARDPDRRYQSCAELIEDLQLLKLHSPALSFFAPAG